MRSFVIYLLASTGAGFVGALLAFTLVVNSPLGAANGAPTTSEAPKVAEPPSAPPAPQIVSPRYTVGNNPPFTHITDNETNRQYVYVNTPNQPSRLLGYIDLHQTGLPELRATKFENGQWSDK